MEKTLKYKIKNRSVLVLMLFLIFHLSAQTTDEKKTAAIFPFHFASIDAEEQEVISGLNELLYDLLAGQFINTGFFEVVDRQNMAALLDEIKLQQAGLTQDQVIEIGKMKGAQLAIFGSVTKVFLQTFLTLKIIDIETTVILKAIKVKGSLKEPDILALDAGTEFMKGLSEVLQDYYHIDEEEIVLKSKEGLKYFLKARELTEQALLAKQEEDDEKMVQLQKEAEDHFEKSIELDSNLKPIVKNYKERIGSLFQEE
jgi:TolB-like protein